MPQLASTGPYHRDNKLPLDKYKYSLPDKFFWSSAPDENFSRNLPCIFTTPFPELPFQMPQLASIGPYHRDKNLPLDKYKYSFLDIFLSRKRNLVQVQGQDLCFYVQQMMILESQTRRCYSKDLSIIYSPEFVEIMLVDGCFVMEILRHFGSGEESEVGTFPIEPWQLPVLVQDLLMLENQIPLFVLEQLFDLSMREDGSTTVSVPTMALKFFNLAFPVSMDLSCKPNHLKADHLLDLFLHSIRPSNPRTKSNALRLFDIAILFLPNLVSSFLKRIKMRDPAGISMIAMDQYILLEETPKSPATNPKIIEVHPSPMHWMPSISARVQFEQQCDPSPMHWMPSISARVQFEQQCDPSPSFSVMELQSTGVKFRPRRADKFTDINFMNGVLEIPPVTMNDLFFTILSNCVALEHGSHRHSKDLSSYVYFMSSLIRHPGDAELLCSSGIISRFSHKNENVVDSFRLLGLSIFDLGTPDPYSCLSKILREMQSYYSCVGKGKIWCCWMYLRAEWKTALLCITNLLPIFMHLWSNNSMLIPSTSISSILLLCCLIHSAYRENESGESLLPNSLSDLLKSVLDLELDLQVSIDSKFKKSAAARKMIKCD